MVTVSALAGVTLRVSRIKFTCSTVLTRVGFAAAILTIISIVAGRTAACVIHKQVCTSATVAWIASALVSIFNILVCVFQVLIAVFTDAVFRLPILTRDNVNRLGESKLSFT
jgi:hypothetical protein